MADALGLGTTALFAAPLVYNTKRSGTFELGGRKYVLRRVVFPVRPTAECNGIRRTRALVEGALEASAA